MNILKVKKYFKFDEESINGGDYMLRIIIGSFLSYIIIGFWIISATTYKRAGAFGWNKDNKTFIAVLIPILQTYYAFSKLDGFGIRGLNSFDISALIVTIIHLFLLCSNGNKNKKETYEKDFQKEDENNLGLNKINLKIKYLNQELHFKLKSTLDETFNGFKTEKSTYILRFMNEGNVAVGMKKLPKSIFKEIDNDYITNGSWAFLSCIELEESIAKSISSFSIDILE